MSNSNMLENMLGRIARKLRSKGETVIYAEDLLIGLLQEDFIITKMYKVAGYGDIQDLMNKRDFSNLRERKQNKSNEMTYDEQVKKIYDAAQPYNEKLELTNMSLTALFFSLKDEALNGDEILQKMFETLNLNWITFEKAFKFIMYNKHYFELNNEDNEDDLDFLEYYGDFFNLQYLQSKDAVIGRDADVLNLINIIGRKNKPNCLLIGKPGVGKTKLIEALARYIHFNDLNKHLNYRYIYSLNLQEVVAGCTLVGQIEERVSKILNKIKRYRDEIIVFIDEIHNCIGAGKGSSGGFDVANMLKTFLASSNVLVIAATTLDEYHKHIEKDAAFSRRFQLLHIDEPTTEVVTEILMKLKSSYETFHNLSIPENIIQLIVRLTDQYMPNKSFPDKAIDALDVIATAVSLSRRQVITEEDVKAIISNLSNVSIIKEESNLEDLIHLEEKLSKKVIGQEEAVSSISNAIIRTMCGVRNPSKPLASFLFVGPTGVGKTELAKNVCMELFGQESAMIRLDMSEYNSPLSIEKLIGDNNPSGKGGYLTNAIKDKPYAIVLFDEIEKAHSDVYNLMLQILDDGRLTDGLGNTVNFKNALIIMTSNAASDVLPFAKDEDERYKLLTTHFKPEFLNRIDEIIPFKHLQEDNILKIIDIEVNKLNDVLSENNNEVKLSDQAKSHIIRKGFNRNFGARSVKRYMKKSLETEISKHMLKEGRLKKQSLYVTVNNDEFVVSNK